MKHVRTDVSSRSLATITFRIVRAGVLIAIAINLVLLSIDLNRSPSCTDRFTQIDLGMSRQQAADILRGRAITGLGSRDWEFADYARFYHLHFDDRTGLVTRKCFGFHERSITFFISPDRMP